MKLPNFQRAYIDITKLRDYSLSSTHPEGKHKARVFAAAVGIGQQDANWLRDELLRASREYDCTLGERDEHGQGYVIDFPLSRGDKRACLRYT